MNGSGPGAEDGLVVLTLSLDLVGADEGAASILHGLDNSNGKLNDGATSLPKEVKEALDTRKGSGLPDSKKFRFQLGAEAFVGRTFLIKPTDGIEPMIGLYVQKDLSVANTIDMVATEYHLTCREREALRGITIGLTSKQMAEQMNISPNTVKSFLRIIMLKMGTTTRTGIVSKVLQGSNGNSHD